jgi:ATP/maltotriose-dependent transcriptional regulator MalT
VSPSGASRDGGRGMPDAVRLQRTTVPDFGSAVPRVRLLRVFDRTRPVATVISAPAAYGKSVLASQIARLFEGGAVWVHLPSACAASTEILSHAIAGFESPHVHGTSSDFVPISPPPTMPELLSKLESLIRHGEPAGACVVFDNLNSEAMAAVSELASAVLERGSGISYVFTLRSTAGLPACPLGAWQVGSRELLLDDWFGVRADSRVCYR